jgi:hypothetical protein
MKAKKKKSNRTKNPTKSNTIKKAMIQALQKTLGVVTAACEKVGIDRTTHYEWLKNDEEYRKAVEDIANIALDFVESKLYGEIQQGNTTAIIYYLKTKGRKRGYVEKQELDINNKITKQPTPEDAAKFFRELKQECDEQ